MDPGRDWGFHGLQQPRTVSPTGATTVLLSGRSPAFNPAQNGQSAQDTHRSAQPSSEINLRFWQNRTTEIDGSLSKSNSTGY